MRKSKIIILTTLLSLFALFGCNKNTTEPDVTPDNSTQLPDVEDGNKEVDLDKQYAQAVIDAINALNDSSTKDEINEVLKAYNDLTIRQQGYVTNYDLLEAQLEKIQIFEDIERIESLITDLSDTSSFEEIVGVVEEYRSIKTKYGEKWQKEISQENVDKLTLMEIDVIKSLISNALAISMINDAGVANFGLLANLIDSLLEDISEFDLPIVYGINEYNATKEEYSYRTGIIYDRGYQCTYVNQSSREIRPDVNKSYSEQFGFLYTVNVENNNDNATLELDIDNEDWRDHESIGFYIKADAPITNMVCLIPNNHWPSSEDWAENKFVMGTPQTIDATNHLYFFQLPLTYLDEVLGVENKTSLTIYFGNKNVKAFSITDLVYLDKDYSELNALLAKANDIDVTTSMGKTQFALFSEYVDERLEGGEVDKLTGYSNYVSKKQTALANIEDVFNMNFTVPPTWDALVKEESEPFGYMKSYTFSPKKDSSIQVFADGAKNLGLNWSEFNKLCLFVQISEATSLNISLTIQDTTQKVVNITPQVFDSDNHIYFCEFNISTLESAFTDNPWVTVYLSTAIDYIKITNWIGVNNG